MDARDAIVRVPGWSHDGDVHIEPLPGGLTNTNHLVTRGVDRFVLRCSGPNAIPLGIDRAQECRAVATAAAIGVGAEVVHCSVADGLLVTRWIDGREPTGDEMRTAAMMQRVVAVLRRVHAIPLSAADPAYCPFAKARRWHAEAQQRGATFPDDFPLLEQRMRQIERRRRPATSKPRFCHNDCVRGNVLIDGHGAIRLIDWEYAGAGDPLFDLAVLSMNNQYDAAADEQLLSMYFRGHVADQHRDNLRALKRAFDYHMGVWYVLQTVVSTIDAPFARGVRWHFDRLRRDLGVPVRAES
jgi:thiamine kinase-like enzyme